MCLLVKRGANMEWTTMLPDSVLLGTKAKIIIIT